MLRMEVERAKYMFKDYLRTRLLKIEKQLVYLIEEEKSELLSEAEADYAFQLNELKKEQISEQLFVPGKIPLELNPFDVQGDAKVDGKYICKPWDKKYVFIRSKIDQENQILGENDQAVHLKANNVYFCQYSAIAPLLAEGQVELI